MSILLTGLFVAASFVALHPAGLAPTRIAYAADCGYYYEQPQNGGSVQLTPNSGSPGSSFSATGNMLEFAEGDYSLIWDWGAEGSQVIASGTIVKNAASVQFNASVPQNASLGAHNVAFCHQVQNELHYLSPVVVFTVQPPATNTPVPTATVPATLTPQPTLTPTPTVTATTVASTATVVPTTTPTASATVVAALAAIVTPLPDTPTPLPAAATATPPAAATAAVATTQATTAPAATPIPQATAAPGLVVSPAAVTSPTPLPSTSTPTATRTPINIEPISLQGLSGGIKADEPKIFAAVPALPDVDTGADVLLTNAGLAGLSLALLFVTASVFNQVVSENQGDIEQWAVRLIAPMRPVQSRLQEMVDRRAAIRHIGWAIFVPLLTILVYGFLSPDFGFNTASVVTVIGLLVAGVAVTYMTEGLEAYLARSRYGQVTGVRIFPVAVLIAVVSVVISRLTGFLPGVVYGFVGTAVYLRPSTLTEEESCRTIAIPAAFMLSLSIACWLLVAPLRDWSDNGTAFVPTLLTGIAISIFVGGLEGMFFNMIPVTFMDGERLLKWNRWVWLALAGISTLLFWQVLLNSQRSYYSGISNASSLVALIVMGSCLVLTVAAWGFFKWRSLQGTSEVEA